MVGCGSSFSGMAAARRGGVRGWFRHGRGWLGEISNAVADHGKDEILNARNMSAFAYLWGQFIDHDLDLTNSGMTESFPVIAKCGDAVPATLPRLVTVSAPKMVSMAGLYVSTN